MQRRHGVGLHFGIEGIGPFDAVPYQAGGGVDLFAGQKGRLVQGGDEVSQSTSVLHMAGSTMGAIEPLALRIGIEITGNSGEID